VLVTKAEVEVEKKKSEEAKDTLAPVVASTQNIPIPPPVVNITPPSSSPVQVVDVDDNESTSEEESTDSDEEAKKAFEEKKKSESAKMVSPVQKNPFSSSAKALTPVRKNMFSVDTLKKEDKVLSTESWLENTLDRKRKRIEDGTPGKDTLSLAIQSGTALGKVKKAKTLSIMGRDPSTGHLTVEIAKPTKDDRIEDLSSNDFELQSVDLEEAQHDTKVDLWKSTTIVIEEELEDLKLAKVQLKAEVQELNNFIR
jgi:hypothetical protein